MVKIWDKLICNGLVFDGSGNPPVKQSIAIYNGDVVAQGSNLPAEKAVEVIDAEGAWVLPGLLDIHTHFDLEVELAPGLPEAVRHGTTTVLVANCSLGLAFGAQRRNGEDPIVDCFARVENIPKSVLKKCADKVDWSDSAAYLTHLNQLPLGVNIVPMIPHSMLRTQVMGLQESVQREPTEAELQEMENLLEQAMEQGYVGFSTDALPFHYLANDPNRRIKIPSQFGSYQELKRLTSIVRKWGRLWQATPPKDNPLQVMRNFLLCSGRLFGKPLKITAVAALDVASNKGLAKGALFMSRFFNSRLINGQLRLQALAAPFKLFWDGPINPLAEEIPAFRELNEPDLEDEQARKALLTDPGFQARFRAMWEQGKSGFTIHSIARKLGMEQLAFSRSLHEMFVYSGGPTQWHGESFELILQRLQNWQRSGKGARSEQEAEAFAAFSNPVGDEAEFLLNLFREYDTGLRWSIVSANQDPQMLEKLLFHPLTLPGFNDSGAHLTNMAFYDANLRGLKLAQERGLDFVAKHVKRLTREPAAFIGIDAGAIEVNSQADIIIIDPQALSNYDSDANTRFELRKEFEHEQLVNRSDGVVTHTIVAGELVWDGKQHTQALGNKRLGRALQHKSHKNVETLKTVNKQQVA